MTAASANACCVPTDIEQGGINRKGVDSPVADNALSGRVTKQFIALGSNAVVDELLVVTAIVVEVLAAPGVTEVVDIDAKVVDIDAKVVDIDAEVVDIDNEVVDIDNEVVDSDAEVPNGIAADTDVVVRLKPPNGTAKTLGMVKKATKAVKAE
jgi:hypothetical protein